MKVIIGKAVYGMNRKQLRGVLKAASSLIPFGIYAVQKDDVCELRKDEFENAEELKKLLRRIKRRDLRCITMNKEGRGYE